MFKKSFKVCAFHKKGLYLHASAVDVSGRALLFLGHSTSGKSTISRLLSDRYPVIADDKVWIYQNKNGEWLVCDGSTGLQAENRNTFSVVLQKQYPLLAVLRIFKSKTTGLKPISPKETCRYLVDSIFEIDIQRILEDLKIRKNWFRAAAKISREVGGWRLTFKKDKSIIGKIHDIFEKGFFEMVNVQRKSKIPRGRK